MIKYLIWGIFVAVGIFFAVVAEKRKNWVQAVGAAVLILFGLGGILMSFLVGAKSPRPVPIQYSVESESKRLEAIKADARAESQRALERQKQNFERLQAESRRIQKANESAQKRREAWRRIHVGLSRQDVENILGEPERISANTLFTMLFYEDGGRVTISSNNLVDGYETPIR